MESATIGSVKTDFPARSSDDSALHGNEAVLTVSSLNRLARETLEGHFPLLWVTGEISNLTRAPSGHLYFTLKDAQAQVRCTMWRNRAQLLGFRAENGMGVEARVLVTLYEPRGDFQLGVEALRPAGPGSLFEAFVRLKDKLSAEGLFDAGAKRSLPLYPRRIAVVTSAAAAAWQDVLATLSRRAPHLEVVLYPAVVQGEGAARSLVDALRTASMRSARDGTDVVLLVRGGGGLEDLQAFNDESLARAIRACPIPLITGIGHETDFTIADFAADVRAATPTGAAELASAGFVDAGNRLSGLAKALSGALRYRLDTLAQRLDRAALRLVHPRERLRLSREGVERLGERLALAMARRLERLATRHRLMHLRLAARQPDIGRESARCAQAGRQLAWAAHELIRSRRERLATLASHLQHLAPQAVLARGYSITRDADGRILRSIAGVESGSAVSVELANGRLRATVNSTEA